MSAVRNWLEEIGFAQYVLRHWSAEVCHIRILAGRASDGSESSIKRREQRPGPFQCLLIR